MAKKKRKAAAKQQPKEELNNSPRTRPMPAGALRAWRTEMGLSERDASDRLGMSRAGLRVAEELGAPLYIALACAALKIGIVPYGMDGNGDWTF